jgi:uncharacterized protein UPF0016
VSETLHIALAAFPVVFVGELPEKTMFASLVLATKGKPRQVWLGAAGAFVVHAVIATTVGVALFATSWPLLGSPWRSGCQPKLANRAWRHRLTRPTVES